MSKCNLYSTALLFIGLFGFSCVSMAQEETPSLEMLLFLADYYDEQGNWDGPELDIDYGDIEKLKGVKDDE